MKRVLLVPGRSAILGFLATIGGCSPSAAPVDVEPRPVPAVAPDACCFREGLAVARRHRVPLIDERRFTSNEYWGAMQGAIDWSPRVRRVIRGSRQRETRYTCTGPGAARAAR